MENVSLRDFIENREAEIKELRSNLLKELKDLKLAKAAIDNIDIEPSDKSSNLTIKNMVLAVLEQQGSPLTAEQIIEGISCRFNQLIERTSLSPQLSRLKNKDFKIEYLDNDKTWALISDLSREIPSASHPHTFPNKEHGGET